MKLGVWWSAWNPESREGPVCVSPAVSMGKGPTGVVNWPQFLKRKSPICCCLVAKLCPTLHDAMDYSLPGFSAHGISQERILEWVRNNWRLDLAEYLFKIPPPFSLFSLQPMAKIPPPFSLFSLQPMAFCSITEQICRSERHAPLRIKMSGIISKV